MTGFDKSISRESDGNKEGSHETTEGSGVRVTTFSTANAGVRLSKTEELRIECLGNVIKKLTYYWEFRERVEYRFEIFHKLRRIHQILFELARLLRIAADPKGTVPRQEAMKSLHG